MKSNQRSSVRLEVTPVTSIEKDAKGVGPLTGAACCSVAYQLLELPCISVVCLVLTHLCGV